MWMPLSFVYILINIVAATVCSLSSLLFPVNYSHFNLWSLPFVPSILPPSPLRGEGKGRENGGWREQPCGLESLSGIMNLQSTIPKPQPLGKPDFAFLPWCRLILMKYEMLGFRCKGNQWLWAQLHLRVDSLTFQTWRHCLSIATFHKQSFNWSRKYHDIREILFWFSLFIRNFSLSCTVQTQLIVSWSH